jgi:hypothetical protein
MPDGTHMMLNGASGNAVNMVDGDQVISQGTIETATLVQVK